MTSKDQIIANIKLGLGEFVPKPNIPTFAGNNTLESFYAKLKLAGGDYLELNDLSELNSLLPQKYPDVNNIVSTFIQLNPRRVPVKF